MRITMFDTNTVTHMDIHTDIPFTDIPILINTAIHITNRLNMISTQPLHIKLVNRLLIYLLRV